MPVTFLAHELLEDNFEKNKGVWSEMMTAWLSGNLGKGPLESGTLVSKLFSTGCTVFALAPTKNASGFRVYNGIGGVLQWFGFFSAFDLPDLTVEEVSSASATTLFVRLSYTPRFRLTGSRSKVKLTDVHEVEICEGKIQRLQIYWGDPAALDALLA